ncbi:MAG: CoA transferase [Acidimicrobiales bacterium]
MDYSQAELPAPARPGVARPRAERWSWWRGGHGNEDPTFAPTGCSGARPGNGDTDWWVAVAVTTDEQWRGARVACWSGRIWRRSTARQGPAGRARDAVVAAWCATRDELEVEHALQAVGVPAHDVGNSPELVADPQLLHRGHFVTVDHALHGPVTIEVEVPLLPHAGYLVPGGADDRSGRLHHPQRAAGLRRRPHRRARRARAARVMPPG